MKKDIIRDYATDAFCFANKYPGCMSLIEHDMVSAAAIDDISAVNNTIHALERDNKEYIVKAIKGVYYYPIAKNDISMRVHKMSLDIPASEESVYRWLKKARDLFAEFRGLRKS